VDAPAGEIRLAVADPDVSAEAVRRLDARRVSIAAIELQQPSLDDVFLTLTGRRPEESPSPSDPSPPDPSPSDPSSSDRALESA
jgi:hypothetical protein